MARVEVSLNEIGYLTVLPAAVAECKRWSCVSDSVGWVAALTANVLSERIQSKREKLTLYRRRIEHMILLVVADQLTNAGRWRSSRAMPLVDGCGFDEVHLLMYPDSTQRIDREAAF